jgi:hypothetical protein
MGGAVGVEVCWRCSPSLLLDGCVVSASLRWRGRVALLCSCGTVTALLECTVLSLRLESGGDEELVRCCLFENVRKARC